MGFSFHPGDLPFVTIRRSDWANRLSLGDLIEIHGEHGCSLEPTAAEVLAVTEYSGMPPAHLADVYRGRKLVLVALGVPADVWRKTGESWEKVG